MLKGDSGNRPSPRSIAIGVLLVAAVITTIVLTRKKNTDTGTHPQAVATAKASGWQPPDSNLLTHSPADELIRYGRKLIANTSYYLGPHGTVAAITNGMNCQNCHLEAGTRAFGNNYSAVYATYPKWRDRSGSIENIYKRVNDCLERSLNGQRIDSNGREMQALYAYLKWLGQSVPRHEKPEGAGITSLAFLDRAADPLKGQAVYMEKCQRCHGKDGDGMKAADSSYLYPPLWGPHSYTTAAGLYRISSFAGYVRDNMPYATVKQPSQLTDEEAWDVAAFVNSQPRPVKKYKEDWPNIATKPIDYPNGPYADGFTERQHKYGPFEPIRQARLKKK